MNNDEYDFEGGIAPCPFCGDLGPIAAMFVDAKYVVICLHDDCGGRGPIHLSREEAIDAWNDPARRELALRWALEVQEAWLTAKAWRERPDNWLKSAHMPVKSMILLHTYDELYATYVKAMKDAGLEVEGE